MPSPDTTHTVITGATLLGRYGMAVLAFGLWLVGGLVLQQVISALLQGAATRRHSRTLQAFGTALKGIIAWVGGLTGFWFAYPRLGLAQTQRNQIEKYLVAATILLIAVFAGRIIGRFIDSYTARENTRLPASSIFSNLVKAVIYVVGIAGIVMTVWPKVSLTPLLGTLGVSGIAVGLALQPTLDNLFSGIQILASRQIEPGDFVQLETGQEGIVEDVTWRNTTIRRITSELIIVPNSVLGKSLVINFSRNAHAYHLVIPSTVVFGTDLKLLEATALAAAHETMEHSHHVYKEDIPDILITANNENGVNFSTVLPILAYRAKATVTSDFLARLQTHLKAANIQQPTPSIITKK